MGLAQDLKLAITFIPQLEKIIADLKVLGDNPAAKQTIEDIQALIASIKAVA